MLNDIFATSMSGEYHTTGSDKTEERGTWEYVGYGNAEIRMTAKGESPSDGTSYELMIHSAERQLDEIEFRSNRGSGNGDADFFRATIAGHDMSVHRRSGDREQFGSITAPDESIHDGPSPIWMIHLMMIAPPPVDREIIAPVIYLDDKHEVVSGRFYRFRRDGLKVEVAQLNEEGELQDHFTIELADDGCPQMIHRNGATTEILRLPHHQTHDN
jgi:hypothetical protein